MRKQEIEGRYYKKRQKEGFCDYCGDKRATFEIKETKLCEECKEKLYGEEGNGKNNE